MYNSNAKSYSISPRPADGGYGHLNAFAFSRINPAKYLNLPWLRRDFTPPPTPAQQEQDVEEEEHEVEIIQESESQQLDKNSISITIHREKEDNKEDYIPNGNDQLNPGNKNSIPSIRIHRIQCPFPSFHEAFGQDALHKPTNFEPTAGKVTAKFVQSYSDEISNPIEDFTKPTQRPRRTPLSSPDVGFVRYIPSFQKRGTPLASQQGVGINEHVPQNHKSQFVEKPIPCFGDNIEVYAGNASAQFVEQPSTTPTPCYNANSEYYVGNCAAQFVEQPPITPVPCYNAYFEYHVGNDAGHFVEHPPIKALPSFGETFGYYKNGTSSGQFGENSSSTTSPACNCNNGSFVENATSHFNEYQPAIMAPSTNYGLIEPTARERNSTQFVEIPTVKQVSSHTFDNRDCPNTVVNAVLQYPMSYNESFVGNAASELIQNLPGPTLTMPIPTIDNLEAIDERITVKQNVQVTHSCNEEISEIQGCKREVTRKRRFDASKQTPPPKNGKLVVQQSGFIPNIVVTPSGTLKAYSSREKRQTQHIPIEKESTRSRLNDPKQRIPNLVVTSGGSLETYSSENLHLRHISGLFRPSLGLGTDLDHANDSDSDIEIVDADDSKPVSVKSTTSSTQPTGIIPDGFIQRNSETIRSFSSAIEADPDPTPCQAQRFGSTRIHKLINSEGHSRFIITNSKIYKVASNMKSETVISEFDNMQDLQEAQRKETDKKENRIRYYKMKHLFENTSPDDCSGMTLIRIVKSALENGKVDQLKQICDMMQMPKSVISDGKELNSGSESRSSESETQYDVSTLLNLLG